MKNAFTPTLFAALCFSLTAFAEAESCNVRHIAHTDCDGTLKGQPVALFLDVSKQGQKLFGAPGCRLNYILEASVTIGSNPSAPLVEFSYFGSQAAMNAAINPLAGTVRLLGFQKQIADVRAVDPVVLSYDGPSTHTFVIHFNGASPLGATDESVTVNCTSRNFSAADI